MPAANRAMLTALHNRKAEMLGELRSFCEGLERRGLKPSEPMDDVSNRRFIRIRDDLMALQRRISEVQGDLDRGYEGSEVQARFSSGGSRRGCANAASRFSPLNFDTEDLRRLHGQIQGQQQGRIEARDFSTADSLLPSQLYPIPTFPLHENRLLNWLPGFACDAPSLEYVQVNGVTGSAAIVPEGGMKPEIVMPSTRIIISMQKLAAHTAVSYENIQDFGAFVTSVQMELIQRIIDVENYFIIQGGLSTYYTGITGLLGTNGILTHNLGSDPTGTTPLDGFEIAIAAMRTGPSLAEPNLIVAHPTTWSGVRRTKDSMSRYLVTPDPAADEPETIWGCPVVTTTQCPLGTAILIDTTKFGRVAVRSPIEVKVGYAGTDFTQNIVRYLAEERLNLAVERPSAILALSGLPTS